MLELADRLASGASARKSVRVRVSLWAQKEIVGGGAGRVPARDQRCKS